MQCLVAPVRKFRIVSNTRALVMRTCAHGAQKKEGKASAIRPSLKQVCTYIVFKRDLVVSVVRRWHHDRQEDTAVD